VGDRRAILDHQHALAVDRRRIVQPHGRCGADDRPVLNHGADFGFDLRHLLRRRRGRLHHHHQIGHPQHRLARMVAGHLSRAQRVGQYDMQVGTQHRKIIVAAVPQDHIGLSPGRGGDFGIVHAREHDVACLDVGLVFLALLDRAVGRVHVGQAGETLAALALQVAIRHGMAQHSRTAQTAITGMPALIMVASGPRSRKSAPAESTREAPCITASWGMSL
jgi:hypothetical protein